MDQSKAVLPNQMAPNRWHVATGGAEPIPANALASSRVPAATVEAATNRPYCSDRETRLDFSKQAIEEFPFWEIAQKSPVAIDLSQNSICEWPESTSISKCRELQELVV